MTKNLDTRKFSTKKLPQPTRKFFSFTTTAIMEKKLQVFIALNTKLMINICQLDYFSNFPDERYSCENVTGQGND